MRFPRASGSLLFILLSVSSVTLAQKEPPLQPGEMLLIGKLTQVMGIGGETTGWALELNSDVTIDGRTYRSIEVSGPQKKLARLVDQEVKARGFIKHRKSVERKDWVVFQISSIQLKKPTGTT